MKRITILVPAYNEANSLPALVNRLNSVVNNSLKDEYQFEYLFVNDGSKDDTLEVLKRLRAEDDKVNFVSLSRNFGKENAMLAGFDYATGDAVIIMDADLQHPAEAIPEMIKKWEEGYEDVFGRRRIRGHESPMRKRLTMLYYDLLQRSTRIEVLRNVGDFRLLDRRCVEAIKTLRETQRYTKGLYCWVGFKKTEFIYDQGDRAAGASSFSLKGLFNLAVEGILCFTTAPLRFATVLGLVVSLLAFIYLMFILVKTIFFGEAVQGFPTLISVILFMGGCQLLAIGIIGEYIARIFTETKHRPVYIADLYNETKVTCH
jgi:glycosyltransferase involved in cell wall biosynthesis